LKNGHNRKFLVRAHFEDKAMIALSHKAHELMMKDVLVEGWTVEPIFDDGPEVEEI
jgi:hypothetical protein